jgi:5'/3'-nucleotidase
MRIWRGVALAAAVLVVASGCELTGSAGRYAAAPGTVPEPFWCAPAGGTALNSTDCVLLSVELDRASVIAHAYFHVSDAVANGATLGSGYATGVGAAYRLRDALDTFDPSTPDVLLYDGTGPDAQVAGMEWNVFSVPSAPAGFTGPNDSWTYEGDNLYRLRVWILRPFQNQVNVFASTHPCLGSTGPIYDLEDPCYTTTHPNDTEVLVSNDDGYAAPGIDAAVEALRAIPTVHVTVSAPLTNQSGSGGKTSPDPLVADHLQTASGYPAWAVHGFPADSVRYALTTLHENPDLLVSGINDGQNIGPIVDASGTVGAARVGARAKIASLAISQELGSPPDFPSGATALDAWVHDFLFGRVGPARFQYIVNINVPTCATGTSIRGTVNVPLATTLTGFSSDCSSTKTPVTDDVDAFTHGFIAVSPIPINPAK